MVRNFCKFCKVNIVDIYFFYVVEKNVLIFKIFFEIELFFVLFMIVCWLFVYKNGFYKILNKNFEFFEVL